MIQMVREMLLVGSVIVQRQFPGCVEMRELWLVNAGLPNAHSAATNSEMYREVGLALMGEKINDNADNRGKCMRKGMLCQEC